MNSSKTKEKYSRLLASPSLLQCLHLQPWSQLPCSQLESFFALFWKWAGFVWSGFSLQSQDSFVGCGTNLQRGKTHSRFTVYDSEIIWSILYDWPLRQFNQSRSKVWRYSFLGLCRNPYSHIGTLKGVMPIILITTLFNYYTISVCRAEN